MKKIEPFSAEFGDVQRFENTDIYFLDVKDPEPFRNAQGIIAESGIRFEPSPYPYRPHCTLKLRKPPKSVEEFFELFFLQAPKEPFTSGSFSANAGPLMKSDVESASESTPRGVTTVAERVPLTGRPVFGLMMCVWRFPSITT